MVVAWVVVVVGWVVTEKGAEKELQRGRVGGKEGGSMCGCCLSLRQTECCWQRYVCRCGR